MDDSTSKEYVKLGLTHTIPQPNSFCYKWSIFSSSAKLTSAKYGTLAQFHYYAKNEIFHIPYRAELDLNYSNISAI